MITLDEIEAVVEVLRERVSTADQWSKSGETAQAIDQAVEIIEALAGDVNQARRALLEINYFTAEALGEKIGRVDDEPSEG